MKTIGRSVSEARELPSFSSYVDVLVLEANVPQSLVVPPGASFASFSGNVDIWVTTRGVAAVPSISSDDGSAPELNPGTRRVSAGTTISVVAATAGSVSVAYFAAGL